MISRLRRHFSKNDTPKADRQGDDSPHATLHAAIRDVDAAVDDLSQNYAAAAGRRIEAERHLSTLTGHIVKLDEKARLALGQNRDDLASAIITQQLAYEKERADWDTALAKAHDEAEKLRTDVAAMKMRKVDLQEQLLREVQAEQQAAKDAAADLGRDMLDQRVAGAIAAYDQAIAPAPLTDNILAEDTSSQPMMIDDEVQTRMNMLRQEVGGTAPGV